MTGEPTAPSPGREALLLATVRVVATGGLRALTYRRVADEAGVSHGLVRHHFGSRDALIAAATRFSLPRAMKAGALGMAYVVRGDLGFALTSAIEDEGDLLAFQYEVVLESRRRPELRPLVAELYSEYRKVMAEELRARGLPADEATAVAAFAALDGLVLQGLALDEPVTTDTAVAALRLMLRAAESERPEAADD